MTRVKICGLTEEKHAIAAARAGADAIGFVFAESVREVSPFRARKICFKLPPFISITGVFVDGNKDGVLEIARKAGLDTLQFHGNETADYCNGFREKNYRVIKAIRVSGTKSLQEIKRFTGAVDAVLLDTYKRGLPGGTGESFDWDLAVQALGPPIILAGGLNPENIGHAIRKVKPYGVDVSGGVEVSKGKKDVNRIYQFITEVRRTDYAIREEK